MLVNVLPPGYLQEEGLSSTSQSFIHESPNLKEYAEHSTEDGTIPACVFVSLLLVSLIRTFHKLSNAKCHSDKGASVIHGLFFPPPHSLSLGTA